MEWALPRAAPMCILQIAACDCCDGDQLGDLCSCTILMRGLLMKMLFQSLCQCYSVLCVGKCRPVWVWYLGLPIEQS